MAATIRIFPCEPYYDGSYTAVGATLIWQAIDDWPKTSVSTLSYANYAGVAVSSFSVACPSLTTFIASGKIRRSDGFYVPRIVFHAKEVDGNTAVYAGVKYDGSSSWEEPSSLKGTAMTTTFTWYNSDVEEEGYSGPIRKLNALKMRFRTYMDTKGLKVAAAYASIIIYKDRMVPSAPSIMVVGGQTLHATGISIDTETDPSFSLFYCDYSNATCVYGTTYDESKWVEWSVGTDHKATYSSTVGQIKSTFWTSGQLPTVASIMSYITINYSGATSWDSGTTYYVQSRVTDCAGNTSPWSSLASFSNLNVGETPWWDDNWTRRAKISFGATHEMLPKGYTISFPFNSGVIKTIATSGHINEAVQHSAEEQICRRGNKTFFTWRSQRDAMIYVCYWNHDTQTLSTIQAIRSVNSMDTHIYPVIGVDSDGWVHCVVGGHNSQQYYYKSQHTMLIDFPGVAVNVGSGKDTYPRIRFDSNQNIYILSRTEYGSTENHVSLVVSFSDHSVTYPSFSSPNYIAYYPPSQALYYGYPRLYIGGFWIDTSDDFHIILNYMDEGIKHRAITHIYSNDSFTWKQISGTVVGTVSFSPNAAQLVDWNKCSKILTSPDPSHGPMFHTNNGGLRVTQAGTIIFSCALMPYGTTWSYWNNKECEPYIVISQPGSTWATINLYNEVGYKIWKHRHGGVIQVYEHPQYGTNVFDYYGIAKTSGEEYFGGELGVWRSIDGGANWSFKFLTKNSANGIPMLSGVPSCYNGKPELILSRLDNIEYYDGSSPGTSFLPSGDDVRIVYQDAQIDRLTENYWNYDDTFINFKLVSTVATNVAISNPPYYIYYGNYFALSTPPRDPNNVYLHFESFEEYEIGDSPTLNGYSWAGAGTTNFQSSGNYAYSGIIRSYGYYLNSHTNKIWSGDKSLFCYNYSILDPLTVTRNFPTYSGYGYEFFTSHWSEGPYYNPLTYRIYISDPTTLISYGTLKNYSFENVTATKPDNWTGTFYSASPTLSVLSTFPNYSFESNPWNIQIDSSQIGAESWTTSYSKFGSYSALIYNVNSTIGNGFVFSTGWNCPTNKYIKFNFWFYIGSWRGSELWPILGLYNTYGTLSSPIITLIINGTTGTWIERNLYILPTTQSKFYWSLKCFHVPSPATVDNISFDYIRALSTYQNKSVLGTRAMKISPTANNVGYSLSSFFVVPTTSDINSLRVSFDFYPSLSNQAFVENLTPLIKVYQSDATTVVGSLNYKNLSTIDYPFSTWNNYDIDLTPTTLNSQYYVYFYVPGTTKEKITCYFDNVYFRSSRLPTGTYYFIKADGSASAPYWQEKTNKAPATWYVYDSSSTYYSSQYHKIRLTIGTQVKGWCDYDQVAFTTNWMAAGYERPTKFVAEIGANNSMFLDHFLIRGFVENPPSPAVTEATIKDFTNYLAMMNIVDLAYFADRRISNISELDKEFIDSLANILSLEFMSVKRIADILILERTSTETLANLLLGDKELKERFANILDIVKADTTNIANIAKLEKAVFHKLATMCFTDKEVKKRMSNILFSSKVEESAINSILVLDKTLRKEIVNILLGDKEFVERVGSYLSSDKEISIRLVNQLLTDKNVINRINNILVPSRTLVSALANYIVNNKEVKSKISNIIVGEYPEEERLANILSLDKEITYNIANILLTDKEVIDSFANIITTDKFVLFRAANLVLTEKTVTGEIENIIQTDKEFIYRLASSIFSEKEVANYIANNIVLEDILTSRIMNYLVISKSLTKRVSNIISTEKEFCNRLANLVNFAIYSSERFVGDIDYKKTREERLNELVNFITMKTFNFAMDIALEKEYSKIGYVGDVTLEKIMLDNKFVQMIDMLAIKMALFTQNLDFTKDFYKKFIENVQLQATSFDNKYIQSSDFLALEISNFAVDIDYVASKIRNFTESVEFLAETIAAYKFSEGVILQDTDKQLFVEMANMISIKTRKFIEDIDLDKHYEFSFSSKIDLERYFYSNFCESLNLASTKLTRFSEFINLVSTNIMVFSEDANFMKNLKSGFTETIHFTSEMLAVYRLFSETVGLSRTHSECISEFAEFIKIIMPNLILLRDPVLI